MIDQNSIDLQLQGIDAIICCHFCDIEFFSFLFFAGFVNYVFFRYKRLTTIGDIALN